MIHQKSTLLKTLSVIFIFLGNILITPCWAMDNVYEEEERTSFLINSKNQVNNEALTDLDDDKSDPSSFHNREDSDNDRGCDSENYLFAFAGVVTSGIAIITGGLAYWLYS